MKIRNIKTNNIFNLPKSEVERLVDNDPNLYEKVSKSSKKNKQNVPDTLKKCPQNLTSYNPIFKQDNILPLIWDEN